VKWDHAVVSAELAARRGRGEAVAFMLDGGPIVAEGRVVIGVSLGQNIGGGCYVVALDAQTGQEVWRFNTIARPGEPAGDSWNGHPLEERFGAGVWTAGSYDPKLHLVYFGTGNTYDTATLLEPNATARPQNAGLYTDTTLALDVRSGKLVWHFQHVNRDVWDLDWVFERSLLTLPVNGVPTDVVVTGGKIAMFDALDRATGRYLFSVDAGLQNLVVAVDPVTGAKQINPDLEPKAGTTALICPNSLGARNWPATAVNPGTHILYVPLIKTCADYAYAPRSPAETAAGGSDIRMAPHPLLDDDGLHAQLAAIDLATRKIVWKKTQRAPFESAILATAGGVIFSGSRDRLFQALDDRTGEVLWETRLNASPSSFPITFTVNGEQYVAIVAGGGGPLDSTGVFSAPEILNPAEGITLCVFKLPKIP
jgi:alcohol dehydrogenase (cytochrome c)